ncbi:MAG: hypothetical protein U0Y10_12155 [Spirosomataceae bacterium]|mgnify:CR=1 FL=1
MKISTQIGLLALAGLMLLRSLVIPVLYMDYQLRKDYIAKYLCVNRDKPQLHCDGKCYLAKRIAAAQEQEQRQAERDFFQKLIEVVSCDSPLVSFRFEPTVAFLKPVLRFYYTDFMPEGSSSAIFHPPLC